jgi:23S rRNA (guanosine2251-2'-O)-methyltransferase
MKIVLILHNIRSVHNVGSIFRTADGFGVEKIYLTGITPTPFDIHERLRKDFVKTALGAEKYVSWESKKSAALLLKKLKKEKYFIVSLEQAKNSVSLDSFDLKYKKKLKNYDGVVLVVGNEVNGIPKSVLGKSDAVVEIPMRGKKESFNVSVATAIALYELVG